MQQFVALVCCVTDPENSSHSNDPTIKFFRDLIKQ